MSYKVMVISQNQWMQNKDGKCSPIIERECEHEHRTLGGAQKCLRKLTKANSDGLWNANWFNAEVRNSDGTPLKDSDCDRLFALQIGQQED